MISQIMKTKTDFSNTKNSDSESVSNDTSDLEFKFKKLDLNIEELLANQFSSFNHIPLSNAINRVDNGTLIIGELCKIFQGRVDMEDKEVGYSTRVSRPNLYENEIRLSTSERALGFLKNYYLYLSKEQSTLRRQLDEEVVFQLDNYKSMRLTDIIKHKTEIEKIMEEIKHNEENLLKAKKSLLKTLDDVQIGKEKLIVIEKSIEDWTTKMTEEKKKEKEKVIGRFLSAFESNPIQEKEKQLRRLERLEAEVGMKVKDIALKKRLLLESMSKKDEVYSKALKSFEMAEKGRLQHTEKTLRKFCQLERAALESRLRLLTLFEEGALTSLDAEADIRLYVEKEKNIENTQRYATSLQIMDWDYATRAVRDRKLSVLTDISAAGAAVAVAATAAPPPSSSSTTMSISALNDQSPETNEVDSSAEPSGVESDPSPPLEELKSDASPSDENQNQAISTTSDPLNDGPTNENFRENRSPTLSSTSSILTKSSLPLTHKLITELIDSHIFQDHSPKNASEPPTEISLSDVEELCGRAFSDQYGMDLFLQILDEKRGRCSELGKPGFDNMKIAMKTFLDKCSEIRDVRSALRIANMSITFHMRAVDSNKISLDGEDPHENGENADNTSHSKKHYIQREQDICQHQLWNQEGFWEEALMIGLKAQLEMMDPVLWDELDSEMVKEKVLALHTMIFGQLGTLAFTMHEMGLPKHEVEKLVLFLSEGAQLGEDLQLELLKSIRVTYGNHDYHEREHSNSSLSSFVKEEGEVEEEDDDEDDEEGHPHQSLDGSKHDDIDDLLDGAVGEGGARGGEGGGGGGGGVGRGEVDGKGAIESTS